MNVFLLAVLLLFLLSFGYGIFNSYEWESDIVFNTMELPFYRIGLFCERQFVTFKEDEEEYLIIIDEVCIGMLLIEVVFKFKKDFEA